MGNPKNKNLEKALGLLENTKLTGNLSSTTIWILGPNGEKVNSNLDQNPIVRGCKLKFAWMDSNRNSLQGYKKFDKSLTGIIDVERDDTPNGPHYTVGELVLVFTTLEAYEDKKNYRRNRGLITAAKVQNSRKEETRNLAGENLSTVTSVLKASLSQSQQNDMKMLKANGNGMTDELAMETVMKSSGQPVQF